MVERDDDVGAGLVEVVDALHLDPEQRAIEDRQRVAERARRHGAADRDGDSEAADAEQHEQAGGRQAGRLQQRRRAARSPAMKAALSTLTPATTRARRSAPAQACTAANTGTMNRPPAIASPARSIANRMPRQELKSRQDSRRGRQSAQRRWLTSRGRCANMPSRTAPSRVGSRMMRPAASQAASPEPIAIEIGEDREAGGDHLFVAAEHSFTSGGISDSDDRADQPEPAGHDAAPPAGAGPRAGTSAARRSSRGRCFAS